MKQKKIYIEIINNLMSERMNNEEYINVLYTVIALILSFNVVLILALIG